MRFDNLYFRVVDADPAQGAYPMAATYIQAKILFLIAFAFAHLAWPGRARNLATIMNRLQKVDDSPECLKLTAYRRSIGKILVLSTVISIVFSHTPKYLMRQPCGSKVESSGKFRIGGQPLVKGIQEDAQSSVSCTPTPSTAFDPSETLMTEHEVTNCV